MSSQNSAAELSTDKADDIISAVEVVIDNNDLDADVPDREEVKKTFAEAATEMYLSTRSGEALSYTINSVAPDGLGSEAEAIFHSQNEGHMELGDLEEHHAKADEDDDGVWGDVLGEIQYVADSDADSVFAVFGIGDDTGRASVTIFESAVEGLDLDGVSLEQGEAYWFRDVVTDEHEGSVGVRVNSASSIEPAPEDFSPDVPDDVEQVVAQIEAVNSPSGLIHRCPDEDCGRVLNAGKCSQHGTVESGNQVRDLRLKLVIGNGTETRELIVQQDLTEELTGIPMEQAEAAARDAHGKEVVEKIMADALHGRTVKVVANDLGGNLLAEEITVLEGAPDPDSVLQDAREMGALA